MEVDIYIKERDGSTEIRVPILPEKIDWSSGGVAMATYEILDVGQVKVPAGTGLAEYKWESILPGENRTDASLFRGTPKKPKAYTDILERWKKKQPVLTLMVTGYPINKDVYLEDFTATPTGGFGDIEYSVIFTEAREIKVGTTTSSKKGSGGKDSKGGTTYTIKTGDTLWAIAQKHYGAGSKWSGIYTANKDIIESTAKKRGYTSSDNGWWIFPGTIIKIP